MGLFKKREKERRLILRDVLQKATYLYHRQNNTPCGSFCYLLWELLFKGGTKIIHETIENDVVWFIGKEYEVWEESGKSELDIIQVSHA